MSIIERLEKFKLESKELPDIEYLKQPDIGGVISRGLAELYKIQPKNPITFLSNWLLNESRSYKIKNQIGEMNNIKQELIAKYKENQQKLEEENKVLIKIQNQKSAEIEEFKNFIKDAKDYELILNTFCDKLKDFTKATGVYIAIRDLKRKKVTESDDDTAHLINDVEVIRYIGFDAEHEKILKGKYLDLEVGVTNYLFNKPPEEEEKKNEENKIEEANNEGGENKPVEEKLEVVKIDEVVREKKIKFFREPRLGCYRAIDITYKSSLSKLSLDSSIECKKEYDQKVIEAEEKRKLKEEELKRQLEEAGNNPDANKENPENQVPVDQQIEEEKVVLTDFQKVPKRYILCLDTMGQDRIFTIQEEEFILTSAKLLKNSWEELEKNLLLKDRDIRFEMIKNEKLYLEANPLDKLPDLEDKFRNDYMTMDIPEKEKDKDPAQLEKFLELHRTFSRAKFLLKSVIEDETLKNIVISFNRMDVDILIKQVIEYDILFQNILYFVGISNSQINEDETNKLQWKKARKFWNEDVLEAIKKYNPFGAKGKVSSFAMVNRLITVLSQDSLKSIENYSLSLARLLEFMQITLNVRKEDVIRRRKIVDDKNTEVEELTKKKEALDAQRTQMIEDAKKECEDKGEEFNMEAFLEDFNSKNPPILNIPDKQNYEIDDDIILE